MKKNGLAARIREEMKKRVRPFRSVQIAQALGLPPGPESERVCRAMRDFVTRGEVERVTYRGISCFRYNPDYRTPVPAKRSRTVKALYLSGTFTAGQIERLTSGPGGPSVNYIQKVIRELLADGQIEIVTEQKRERSYGLERVYRIIDRNRFRKEEM